MTTIQRRYYLSKRSSTVGAEPEKPGMIGNLVFAGGLIWFLWRMIFGGGLLGKGD